MSRGAGTDDSNRIERIFDEFNVSWNNYWTAYVELQNQLYECVKAAREVSWLAATDTSKLSEINSAQRELFSSMPRRMDYEPLGQISRDLDSALSKLDQLKSALLVEKTKCEKLQVAIDLLIERAAITKNELMTKQR